MCGILFTTKPDTDSDRFSRALEIMKHRGPDASGILSHEKIRMGHTRLKIIDLDDRSNQPFYSNNKRYLMVYNGEIYNFKELAEKYALNMRTTSDTEVVIELFAKLGPKMLEEFNGMFSLVIYDTQTEKVFIARDRLGIKPLYIAEEKDGITVASEIAPVLELIGGSPVDETGLRQYRKLRTFFNGRTLYSKISVFPAGSYYYDGKIVNYWDFTGEKANQPAEEEVAELIRSSVDYRCISDVPVGSYLSGGLDSTIVAGLASKPHTWTVGFEKMNEFSWAKLAAEKFKAEHSEVMISEEEFKEIAEFMINKRKEPLSVPNEVLIYKMTKQVKTKNTVILSGEGADELFFGYDRIFRWAAENKWDIREFDKFYSYGANDDIEIIEDVLEPYMYLNQPELIVAKFFQKAHLHGLLRRLDNSTMLCSVEARVPFVDHRLVELMAGVGIEYRMKDGIVKEPLKRMFNDLLPIEIIERKKVGFPVPLGDIFTKEEEIRPMDRWLKYNLSVLGIEGE